MYCSVAFFASHLVYRSRGQHGRCQALTSPMNSSKASTQNKVVSHSFLFHEFLYSALNDLDFCKKPTDKADGTRVKATSFVVRRRSLIQFTDGDGRFYLKVQLW
ncbi:uncharacterized protein PHALS_14714 [Plasmopara halstedii]|uniref:Uncharacterized protein n=1 Tax=Plasmopara halstedii TaxID=4781 RepID=A0A0N7L687_PLAHL|nr:uncharacterized protein PHALS_14714 [Plasmopara halstedii]CEG43587.1 hypothetical protein PHALS_14714 [Plasmopara halstedii]|eukprot:XP_024579956.1 hypothetical protein PHALS_14714 [Plasmopara halstedii]